MIIIVYSKVSITVLPTVADHKVTNGMGRQIYNKNLVVKQFFNFSNTVKSEIKAAACIFFWRFLVRLVYEGGL